MAAWTWWKYAIFVPLSLASTEFRKNVEIPQKCSEFRIPWTTVVPNYHHNHNHYHHHYHHHQQQQQTTTNNNNNNNNRQCQSDTEAS